MTPPPTSTTCPHCQHVAPPLRWYEAYGRIRGVCRACGAVLFDNSKRKQQEGTKQHANR